MGDNTGEPERLIRLTPAAVLDLAGIDNITAVIWGPEQADRYIAFLNEMLKQIAADPALGTKVPHRAGVFVRIAKFSGRRSSHGHRIFYREIPRGVRILRILHTSMDWKSIID